MAITLANARLMINKIRNGYRKDLGELMAALVEGDFNQVGGVALTASAAELNYIADWQARAVVPTADGLTTGLILATDNTVISTSGNAAHIITLPAIASVPLGWRCWVFPGNATAQVVRTVAASNTTINNVDADGGAASMAMATTLCACFTKISTTNYMAELYAPAGTRTIPTPA